MGTKNTILFRRARMGNKIDILFQQWNNFDSKVLLSERKDTEPIAIENLVAETTKYCRYSGRLTWILLDWIIRNIEEINTEKLIELTNKSGDITVLGLITDLANQKQTNIRFEYILKSSKPSEKKEVFFYRVLKSKLATKLTIENTLPIYDKWNFYCNEIRYLTTDNELKDKIFA